MRLFITPSTQSSDAFLKVVGMGYRYRRLQYQRSLQGHLEKKSAGEFAALRNLFEGDTHGQRRSCRRFSVLLPAVIRSGENVFHGMLINFSGNGMLLATTVKPHRNETLQVKIGRPGDVEYLFTCQIRRSARVQNMVGLGCSYNEVPIEIRQAPVVHGKPPAPRHIRPTLPWEASPPPYINN